MKYVGYSEFKAAEIVFKRVILNDWRIEIGDWGHKDGDDDDDETYMNSIVWPMVQYATRHFR